MFFKKRASKNIVLGLVDIKTQPPFAKSYVDRDQAYTAYVTAMKTYAYMIIDHSNGQFNITAGV